jgi:hypothetical protein
MWFLICSEEESVRAEREVTLSMLLWSIGIWGLRSSTANYIRRRTIDCDFSNAGDSSVFCRS